MASFLASSSRSLTANGFPKDLPANSGKHLANFFIDAPKGVKSVRDFENISSDGVVSVNRVVSYSMLTTISGTPVICWVSIRRTDYLEGGHPGDNTVETLMDQLLAKQTDHGSLPELDILADVDLVDAKNVIVRSGRPGKATFA